MYRLFAFLGQSFVNGWSAFQSWFRHLRGQFSPATFGLCVALVLALAAAVIAACCKCLPLLLGLLVLIGILALLRSFERLILFL